LWALGSRELAEIYGALGRRLKKSEVVAVEPSDVT
jgi:hypothetical protein